VPRKNLALERHLQKLANAAQTSFAERALLQDRTRFLLKVNNEAKVRRSTKSVVLGKAKVMSYEDLEEARAKRAEKEAAKEAKGKGKRRKPKSAGPEVEASADKGKRGRKRKSTEPEPKAKVARMIESPEPVEGPSGADAPQWRG
jgi:hypothetical protein